MVGGTVYRNPYETGQALIAWSFSEWRYFDGWATVSGIDLLKVSCPRFMNLIFHFLTKDADSESRREFEQKLEDLEREIANKIAIAEQDMEKEERKIETKGDKLIVSASPWKAPPGWKPPGWQSDEQNMANIQALMGPQMTGNKDLK